jgi:hypothetical protein
MTMKEQHQWPFAGADIEQPRSIACGIATFSRWPNCCLGKGCANRRGDDRRQPKPGARDEEAPTLDLVSFCHPTCPLSSHEMMKAAAQNLTTGSDH